jgi:hypothetical protein
MNNYKIFWDFDTMSQHKKCRLHTKLRKHIENDELNVLKNSKNGERKSITILKQILEIASGDSTQIVKGGTMYNICKFVCRYHKKYKYKKTKRKLTETFYVCCACFPDECDGRHRCALRGECKCDDICEKYGDRIMDCDNNYEDTIQTYKVKTYTTKHFEIIWSIRWLPDGVHDGWLA